VTRGKVMDMSNRRQRKTEPDIARMALERSNALLKMIRELQWEVADMRADLNELRAHLPMVRS